MTKTELIDRAIESAKGRVYYIRENTSPDCAYTHWVKANNQIELQNITVEALEKMKPKKPVDDKCCFCGKSVALIDNYCSNCGQRIDWSRE